MDSEEEIPPEEEPAVDSEGVEQGAEQQSEEEIPPEEEVPTEGDSQTAGKNFLID